MAATDKGSEEMETGEESSRRGTKRPNPRPGGPEADTESDNVDQATAIVVPKPAPPAPLSRELSSICGGLWMKKSPTYARRIPLNEFNGFIHALYNNIVATLNHGWEKDSEKIFSYEKFLVAMQRAQQMRLSTVVRSLKTTDSKLPASLEREFYIPKPFSVILNSLGICTLNWGTIKFMPYPAKEPSNDTVESQFQKIKMEYIDFVDLIRSQSCIPLDTLGGLPTGTAFWLCNTVKVANFQESAHINAMEMKVLAPYADVPPTALHDAMLAGRGITNVNFLPAWPYGEQEPDTNRIFLRYTCASQTFVDCRKERCKFFNMRVTNR